MRDALGPNAPHLVHSRPHTGSSERLTIGEFPSGAAAAWAVIASAVALALGVWWVLL